MDFFQYPLFWGRDLEYHLIRLQIHQGFVAVDSIVSGGCILSGGMVERCVLAPGARINSYSHVEESILFRGADIGRHARVRKAIIEKKVQIPEHAVIGYDPEYDATYLKVTEKGVVVVDSTSDLSAAVNTAVPVG